VNSNVGGSGLSSGGQGPKHGTPPKGSGGAGPKNEKPLGDAPKHVILARVVDKDTQKPVSGAKWEVLDADGMVLSKGTTDWQGAVEAKVAKAGSYTVQVVELPEAAT
jgi:hypothetical protein